MARGVTVALNTVPERVSVLEVKVENIDNKLDDIKVDVKDLHDCLDRTRDSVMEQLSKMHDDSCAQHNELARKIKDLEQFKQKWVYMVAGGIAVAGWVSGHIDTLVGILK
jgi:peptidoglycan hydrolase CwlO-like protein